MTYVVNKLGGEIAGSAVYSAKAIEVLKAQLKGGYKPLVVVSAARVPNGIEVTDTLRNAFGYLSATNKGAAQKRGVAEYLEKSVMTPLRSLHNGIITRHISDAERRARAASEVGRLLAELESDFWSVYEHGPAAENFDSLVYHGEALRAAILLEELQEAGMRAVLIEPRQTSVITDSNFGNASVQLDATGESVGKGILPALDDGYVVIEPGFFGRTPDGRIATLGSGGSDSKAVALAMATGGEAYLWKTTPVRSGDPKIIGGNTRVVRNLKYQEAVEAGRIVQPAAIILAHAGGKELYVPDITEPETRTLIDGKGDPEREVKIVSLANETFFAISSPMLDSVSGYPHGIFGNHGINITTMHSAERGSVIVTGVANGVNSSFQDAVEEFRKMGYDAAAQPARVVRIIGDDIRPRTAEKINAIARPYGPLVGATPTLGPSYAKTVVLPEVPDAFFVAHGEEVKHIRHGERLTRELHRKLVMSR